MDASIREYRPTDQTEVLDLSLRAWEPNFASMEDVLGREICTRLHGDDWRAYQSKCVRDVLADRAIQVWVGENANGNLVGFAAAKVVDLDRRLGEVVMVAVDPGGSGRGLGTVLTQHATDWLRAQGMQTAMIGTGGDAGHAAARRTYAKAGYTLMPLARYFKALW
jgi:GNAT superfamily N-acetyltransferase